MRKFIVLFWTNNKTVLPIANGKSSHKTIHFQKYQLLNLYNQNLTNKTQQIQCTLGQININMKQTDGVANFHPPWFSTKMCDLQREFTFIFGQFLKQNNLIKQRRSQLLFQNGITLAGRHQFYKSNNCILVMDQYRLGKKKGDGTFSEVFQAQSVDGDQLVAIKCMKKKYQSIDHVKKLTQIQVLKLLSPHDHIINLIEVLFDQPTGKLALVFELMEENMYEYLVNNRGVNLMKVKYYMYCLLKGIAFVHKKGIFHRDIKPENVLISDNQVKLADFGSSRKINSKQPYTEYISTRWYRAPECLLTDGFYTHKMDIWGFGCVLYQMNSRYPLFNGKNQIDQINRINKVLGTPSDPLLNKFKQHASHMKPEQWKFAKYKGVHLSRLLSHPSEQLVQLLYRLLAYDPDQRIEAEEALSHPYFSDLAQSVKIDKLGSTLMSMNRSSRGKSKSEKRSKGKLAQLKQSKQNEDKENMKSGKASLPQIQNVKVAALTQTATFKKTGWGLFTRKKH